jgi:hypothetical protein
MDFLCFEIRTSKGSVTEYCYSVPCCTIKIIIIIQNVHVYLLYIEYNVLNCGIRFYIMFEEKASLLLGECTHAISADQDQPAHLSVASGQLFDIQY